MAVHPPALWGLQRILTADWHAALLSDTSASPRELSHPALESRILVGYIATASFLIILWSALWAHRGSVYSNETEDPILVSKLRTHPPSHGSWSTVIPRIAQLLACAGVFASSVITAMRGEHSISHIVLTISSAYALLLTAILPSLPASISRVVSFHATSISFVIFMVYAYRDIWPLATWTLEPADQGEGWLLWSRIVLAGIAGIVSPLFEPWSNPPVDVSEHEGPINPEQTSSIFSILSASYLDPLVWQSRKVKHLALDMLPPQLSGDKMSALSSTFFYLDPFNLPRRQTNVYTGLLRAFRTSWCLQILIMACNALLALGSPVGVNGLLLNIESGGQGATVKRWAWILLITLAPMVQEVTNQLYSYFNTRTSSHIEAVLTSLVYQHSLRARVAGGHTGEPSGVLDIGEVIPRLEAPLDIDVTRDDDHLETSALEESVLDSTEEGQTKPQANTDETEPRKTPTVDLIGQLQSFVTSDLANITGGKDWVIPLIKVPLQLVLGTVFLYRILGWSALVGLFVMVILTPVPALMNKLMNNAQKEKMIATDARVGYVKEIIGMLRMVKLFGWEQKVKEEIDQYRKAELHLILHQKILQCIYMIISYVVPVVQMVVTFAIFTLWMKQPLTASVVFSALQGFQLIRTAFLILVFYTSALIRANVSLGRIQDFLNHTELLDRYTDDLGYDGVFADREEHLGLGHATFSWSKNSHNLNRTFQLSIDEDIHFKQGALNLIVGPTGCGKTSLIMALLGEMHYNTSGPNTWVNIPARNGVAYCAQESWIRSLSVKDNILFGAPFDEARYHKVVHQCGLERDFSLFESGDATEIGEKGLNLSGGQKARIALARAVYSSAQTILLDDVLAALDVHTSVWIVNKCLKGDLLRGRTVILATHNIDLTYSAAEYVVRLDSNGRLHGQGVPKVVIDKDYLAEVAHGHTTAEFKPNEEQEACAPEDMTVFEPSPLVLAEEIHEGHISWNAVQLLLSSLSAWPVSFACAYLIVTTIGEGFDILETRWLGYWAEQFGRPHVPDSGYFIGVHIAIVLAIATSYLAGSIMSAFASFRAGRVIHDQLSESLLIATFRWLDTTPTSRIMTRCTQDVQSIDGPLVQLTSHFVSTLMTALTRMLAVAVSAPTYALPSLIIGSFGMLIGHVYIKAQLPVKRNQAIAKTSVLAAVNEVFSGLVTIRAFKVQAMFAAHTMDTINQYTQVSIVFWNLNRWVAIRAQTLNSLYSGGLLFYLVYGPGHQNRTASMIGFALSMAVAFSEVLLQLVRQFNMLEIEGNSVERIYSYLNIEKEPTPKNTGVPPAYWPSSGTLVVTDLYASYSPDGPDILTNISFTIKAGERVGVVGRTGAGKSTLALALLRCIRTQGCVKYDDVETSSLNLDALRSHITIIPQAPELISGTLRKNLDMFEEHDDSELNSALRSAGWFTLHTDGHDNRFTLDDNIAGGGANLSVGQRQMIALARAIIRQSKILILDEATSALDYQIDSIIQSSLRTGLGKDVTVLTIAHRLQTIMDYDKIMVLDAGRLIQFDSPSALLQIQGGLFRALVDESSDRNTLYSMVPQSAGHENSEA